MSVRPGFGCCRRRAIQRRLERRDDRVVGRFVRPRQPGRRHLARPQFADDFLPHLGMLRDVERRDRVQIEVALIVIGVMTGEAVPVDERDVRRGRRAREPLAPRGRRSRGGERPSRTGLAAPGVGRATAGERCAAVCGWACNDHLTPKAINSRAAPENVPRVELRICADHTHPARRRRHPSAMFAIAYGINSGVSGQPRMIIIHRMDRLQDNAWRPTEGLCRGFQDLLPTAMIEMRAQRAGRSRRV